MCVRGKDVVRETKGSDGEQSEAVQSSVLSQVFSGL